MAHAIDRAAKPPTPRNQGVALESRGTRGRDQTRRAWRDARALSKCATRDALFADLSVPLWEYLIDGVLELVR